MSGKQHAFLAAKLIFALVVTVFLLSRTDVSRVLSHIYNAKPLPIALGFALLLGAVVVAGWRWQRLLAMIGIPVSLRNLTCIAQVGQFFAIFLPGPTGDDITRMLYISRIARERVVETCATVFIDRCLGLFSILLLALACIPGQWKILETSPQTAWIAALLLSLGAAALLGGLCFFLTPVRLGLALVAAISGRFPQSQIVAKLAGVASLMIKNKLTILQVTAAAIGTQVIICTAFYLSGIAADVQVPLLLWLSFVPVVLAANAVPITIGGLGVREYLLVLFLGTTAAIDSERALAASLIVFAMTIALSLTGGFVYIFYRPRKLAPSS